MELSKQVVSLELAKQMKELGFNQKSLWYWREDGKIYESDIKNIQEKKFTFGKKIFDGYVFYSSYTVAELGEMLPNESYSMKSPLGRWFCTSRIYDEAYFEGKTEADSRAKMLIHLKQNNMM